MFDTHAHLDRPQIAGQLDAVLARAHAAGVTHILCVGTDLRSSQRAVELARRYPCCLRAAVGLHPTDVRANWEEEFAHLAELSELPEVVAIGETGLDLYRAEAPLALQVEALERHIALAAQSRKPLLLHARRADEELLALLAEHRPQVPVVRHCFDSTPSVARRYVDLGAYLAFGGAVTRPGHKKLKAAARAVPADRLLVETDCPYQCPHGMPPPNEPACLVQVVGALAAVRGNSPEEVAQLTEANALSLFGPG